MSAPLCFLLRLSSLCAVAVVDGTQLKAGEPNLARIFVDIADLQPASQTCRTRALVEFERRFCGSDKEEPTGKPILVNDRELTCTLLDWRTKSGRHLTEEQKARAIVLVKAAHVQFEQTADAFAADAQLELEHAAKRLKPAAAPAAESEAPQTPVRESNASLLVFGQSFDPNDTGYSPMASNTPPVNAALDDARAREQRELHAERSVSRWLKLYKPDLKAEFADLRSYDVVEDLMFRPVGNIYGNLTRDLCGKPHPAYGYLPLMATSSPYQIGSLMAESFCERMLSCANLVMPEGSTLLGDEELEMLVLLKMNRDFMTYCRVRYPALPK